MKLLQTLGKTCKVVLVSLPLIALFLAAITTVGTLGGCFNVIVSVEIPECPNNDSAWAAAETVPIGCCPTDLSKAEYVHISCCAFASPDDSLLCSELFQEVEEETYTLNDPLNRYEPSPGSGSP